MLGRPQRKITTSALVALALVTASCSDDSDQDSTLDTTLAAESTTDATGSTATTPDTAADTAAEAPTVATLDVTAVEGPYSTISAAVTVESSEPVQVRMTATAGEHVVETPLTAASATTHELPLVGLRAEQAYDIEVTAVGEGGDELATGASEFRSGALPDDFLAYEFTADPDRSSPGYTFVEVVPGASDAYLFAVDQEGETVWYYRNTSAVAGLETTSAGTMISHYWPAGVREFDILGNVTGNWQFAPNQSDEPEAESATSDAADGDDRSEVVDEDRLDEFLTSLEGNPADPEPILVAPDWVELRSFHHEAIELPNGNILAMGTTEHELTPAQRAALCPDDDEEFNAVSDLMVEFERSGRVVRTWDTWDVIDIEEVPGHELCILDGPFASPHARDWTHGNAAIYDPDRDAIIVSLRHTNQVVAMPYGDEEGPQEELLWILGEAGTLPLEGDPPYYQHAVELQDDGSVLLYDNGNDRPGTTPGDDADPTYSRAVLYEIDDSSVDPSDWTATQVWEHRAVNDDSSPVYARFLGDADRLENGNVLIDHGGIDDFEAEDDQRVVVIEVEPEGGEIVWELTMGAPGPETVSYRAERIPSLYFGPLWADAE